MVAIEVRKHLETDAVIISFSEPLTRSERRTKRRVHAAHFPRMKRLDTFDLDAAPTIKPATSATLAAGNYRDAGDPVVLLGDRDTGKTHLLIAIGIAACEQGRRVRYVTAAQLVKTDDDRKLSRLVTRYGRLDLPCLDELGYVQLDTRGAELLFQIITAREQKNTIAVASNRCFAFQGWIVGSRARSGRPAQSRHRTR